MRSMIRMDGKEGGRETIGVFEDSIGDCPIVRWLISLATITAVAVAANIIGSRAQIWTEWRL